MLEIHVDDAGNSLKIHLIPATSGDSREVVTVFGPQSEATLDTFYKVFAYLFNNEDT